MNMGFPRVLSKNNKIYTKLGDFCLSCDGHNFSILCFLCQQELQTQDQFWKHIQDEHNFLQTLKQEHNSIETANTSLLPIPLYRKPNEDEQNVSAEQETEHQHKSYAEMRDPNNVDIKVEPQMLPPPAATQLGINVTQAALYQIPQAPPVSAYTTIVQTPTLPAINMSMVGPPPAPELPKESNNTAASSAVSEDGERWFICDYETCGLKFKYQSRLELHRAVHSKERRFACELCGASFKQSCNLSTHRKKKHFLKGLKGLVQQHY